MASNNVFKAAALSLPCITLAALIAAAPAPAQETERIIVIGTTPVGADDLELRDFPGRIQTVDSDMLEDSTSPDISDYLNRNFSGVHINSAQGNPLQPDLYYRGYAASPLLGLPIGITVYQNGVRLNEPLGDTVNWDLVPMSAIANMSLLGGSNALYGLNTLGGAIVMEMKTGFDYTGHSVESEAGSYQRVITNFESGGNDGRLAYYINAQRFYEDGWRDLSNSWSENLYASIDWRHDHGSLGVNFHRGLSDLTGNGLSPVGLLDRDRDAIFTAPDITRHNMYMWVVKGDYELTDDINLSGNFYIRDNDTGSFNGDAAEEEEEENGMNGDDDCETRDRNGEEVESDSGRCAVNNISSRGQRSLGGVLELDFQSRAFGLEHDIDLGVGYRQGRSRFDSRVQNALLDPNTRSTQHGPGAVTGEFEDDDNTAVRTRVENRYVYLGDTVMIGEHWTASVSGYYHDSEIKLSDRTGEQPELNGKHDFNNFNWGVGVVHHWNPSIDVYGGYSESSRLPTPIELACSEEILDRLAAANPGQETECRLPNAFLADPPLDEIIAENVEFGLRGVMPNNWNWSLGAFYTRNKDDIIFQGTGRARGSFKNVDETRRVGIEAALSGRTGPFNWSLNYSHVEATFEDDFQVLSPGEEEDGDLECFHPGAQEIGDACKLQVEKGDTIPGTPEDIFKAAVDYAVNDQFSVGLDMIAVSKSYLRGDESNQLDRVSGYAVFNARARYRFNDTIEAFVNVENLFDKDYENFGLIGEEPNEVVGLNNIEGTPHFLGPGAPISAFAGVKVRF